MLDGEGFAKAHEVFDGNRNDSTTVEEMLAALEKRIGVKAGATVTVDRGMAYEKNIEQIRGRGYHYLVAARPEQRWEHEREFEEEAGWEESAPALAGPPVAEEDAGVDQAVPVRPGGAHLVPERTRPAERPGDS